MTINVNEVENKKYKEALKKMVETLYALNIPKKASKKRFEAAKAEIEKIAERYEIKCDVDYWINEKGESPKNGFQVLNMWFDKKINHLVYTNKPYERQKEWLIYRY